MLYSFLYPLREIEALSFLRVLSSVNVRLTGAFLTSLFLTWFLGPKFIDFLKKLRFGENIRHDGPQSHHQKAGTPTMGGLLFITTSSFAVLLWGYLSNTYLLAVWFGTLLLSLLGFWDDYLKTVLKKKKGIPPLRKLMFQVSIALLFSLAIYLRPYVPTERPTQFMDLFLPFKINPVFSLGLFAILFWILVIVGSSNAVNLTDGLDGLAVGISAVVIAALMVFAYVSGLKEIAHFIRVPYIPEANELTVFLGALLGGCIGFLWYNSHPAEVFMGDTGSLALGGAIGMTAVAIRRELMLLILGGIFVVEALSVMLQVFSYKLRGGKRIFKMAPLHHHFELSGWHENKVVIRFWIIGTLLAVLSLLSLTPLKVL
ncbi:MAG: phospho-N-acetylmuramoyl-pentapeptide-transferase [Leptospiraceae bacterium]|nr:phospho-N-acetylmuramoyl-pentapeptide-transferase [Leptospiraceae bacterium]MDW8305689.1 phospho-N-acetylmuramoyl-pentapeptide-transferase [Leptospiraceae bacterium]